MPMRIAATPIAAISVVRGRLAALRPNVLPDSIIMGQNTPPSIRPLEDSSP